MEGKTKGEGASADVHEHEDRRRERGAAVARDGEQLEEFVPGASVDFLLRLKQDMDICEDGP